MAQVFPQAANSVAKLSLVLAVLAPAGLLYTASAVTRSPYNTKVDVPLDQPVKFSHAHHAVELGIDCRYCHSTVEKSSFAGIPPTHTCMSCHSQIWTNSPLLEPVRESFRTGVPLAWNRVNKLPEFVYFNHAIHVNRGVSCNFCHGAMNQMQLTAKGKTFFMSWCLECHKAPEKFVREPGSVFRLYQKIQSGETLDPEEQALAAGRAYTRTGEQLERGRQLVKQYRIDTDQLTDCWVCHR